VVAADCAGPGADRLGEHPHPPAWRPRRVKAGCRRGCGWCWPAAVIEDRLRAGR
jgi:hypothetical protein